MRPPRKTHHNSKDIKYFGPPVTTSSRPTCDTSGKAIYNSKQDARKAMVGQMGSKSIRAYPCNDCHGFHVTKDWKNKRNN